MLTSTGAGSSGSTGAADDAGGGGADDGALLGAGAALDGALDGVALLAVTVVFPPPVGLDVGDAALDGRCVSVLSSLLYSLSASNNGSESDSIFDSMVLLLLDSTSDEAR